VLCCLWEQVANQWTQQGETAQIGSQWKTDNVDKYIASLLQQLNDSREINSNLRDELHKLQQRKVRHAGFVHALSLSKESMLMRWLCYLSHFLLFKQVTNVYKTWYQQYAIRCHSSTTNFNSVQSITTWHPLGLCISGFLVYILLCMCVTMETRPAISQQGSVS
jgi:hypothetical protein